MYTVVYYYTVKPLFPSAKMLPLNLFPQIHQQDVIIMIIIIVVIIVIIKITREMRREKNILSTRLLEKDILNEKKSTPLNSEMVGQKVVSPQAVEKWNSHNHCS